MEEKVEAVIDFISWIPESLQMVPAAMKLKDVCPLEEKLCPTWQRIKKQRHHFANKGPHSPSYSFSTGHVQMWQLDHKEGLSAKELWGVCFELWCWRRLLRAPWTARRLKQSILKEIDPDYSFEGLMLSWSSNTLATWWEEPTHSKRPWCWERLKAKGEDGNRGRENTENSLNMEIMRGKVREW